MIQRNDLRTLARGRIKDAQVLLEGKRYDSAVYLCGYAIELALKARICRTLKWQGYPDTRKEFEGFQSFRSHALKLLLTLSGQESRIRARHFADWSAVVDWNPELRYSPIGTSSRQSAQKMIESALRLLRVL